MKNKPIETQRQEKLHEYLRCSGVTIIALSKILKIPKDRLYHISMGRSKRLSEIDEKKLENHYKNFYNN